MIRLRSLFAAALAAVAWSGTAVAQSAAPLRLEAKIPLGKVAGRIDHLAIDLKRNRMFVAELGNNSLCVVDVRKREVVQTLFGLKEPQGVGYDPNQDRIYVANAGDGVVSVFQGSDLSRVGRIDLSQDADNIRIDSTAHQVLVGYSDGLAVLDAISGQRIADVPLPGHPESFQLDPTGKLVFINVPEAHQIAVVDRTLGKQTEAWKVPGAEANFPMALDSANGVLLTVFRKPPAVAILQLAGGQVQARLPTCGDADDIFIDAKRQRFYVICGEGFVEVFEKQQGAYRSVGRVPTVSGARTGLFVPELDRLFVAARESNNNPAALWVLDPGSPP
jgi:DNA-binding beta-propeller fold protein YncE